MKLTARAHAACVACGTNLPMVVNHHRLRHLASVLSRKRLRHREALRVTWTTPRAQAAHPTLGVRRSGKGVTT